MVFIIRSLFLQFGMSSFQFSTDLFSHHAMKKESHEVDAFKEGEGPGVM